MSCSQKIESVQKYLRESYIDGWLLYDFRRNNDLACGFLEIPEKTLLTRRFFYWIPKVGVPIRIVSGIERHCFEHLPGKEVVYQTWQDLHSELEKVLEESAIVAMEYSPCNALPYVSKVDAGTIELVRSTGVEVVGSGDILQLYTCILTDMQVKSHFEAAEFLDQTASKTWEFIKERLETGTFVHEHEVQQFILEEFEKNNCVTSDPPICAVNSHSANPHYSPSSKNPVRIERGDYILIDLWCKKNKPGAIYGDITRVGIAAAHPSKKQQEIFEIVKTARDLATQLVEEKFSIGDPLCGWEVDQMARSVIEKAGFGNYFIHRTGHNIGEKDHGNGAHLDNYETKDTRSLLPGTCFSIEPGIYLPGEFGVRLEYDVYVSPDSQVMVTGGVQDSIMTLFS